MSDSTAAAGYATEDGETQGKDGPRVLVARSNALVSYRGRKIALGQNWAGKRVSIIEPKPDHVVVRDHATDVVIRELDLGPIGTYHNLGRRTSALQRKAGLRFAATGGAVTYNRRTIRLGQAWAGKHVIVSEPKPDHVIVRDAATGAVIRELNLGPIGTYHGLCRQPSAIPRRTGPRTVPVGRSIGYAGRTIAIGKDWVGKLIIVTEPQPDHLVVHDAATGAVIRELDLGPVGTYHGNGRKPPAPQRKTGPRQLDAAGSISYAGRRIGFGKDQAGRSVIVTEPKPDHMVITDHATGEVLRTVDLGPVGTYHGSGVPARLGRRKTGPRRLVVTRSGAAVTYNGRNIALGAVWAGKPVILDEPTPGRVVIRDHATGELVRELKLGPVGAYHGTGGKPGGVRKAVGRVQQKMQTC